MRIIATRLMMAMALVGLGAAGTGCDQEPEGSCITSTFSTDFGGSGALFNLFQIGAAN